MKQRSRRVDKKLHRRWLDDVMADASQASHWRTRLFDSKPGKVIEISWRDASELSSMVTRAIEKYRLRFSVSTAPAAETGSWLNQNGNVIFKFWATDFPGVIRFSGNNPAVR
jgi:hypothetical protein